LKKVFVVLFVLVIAVAAFLYFPRGAAVGTANAATLAILNTAIDGSRSGAAFAPALDGEAFANGDVVKSNDSGRAVLTFFDGSSLAVDPGSQVRVVSLNRVAGDGLQVTIEQTFGRTWASVQKLKTPDSKFEVRTPSSTAAVRGTAFQTIVERRPDGTTQTTFLADDGTLLVSATAGGTTTVNAGTQVTVGENQTAPPTSLPIPPAPRLDITGSAGLGFTAMSPQGQLCNPGGQFQQVPGCVGNAQANKVSVRAPAGGRWGLLLTAASALQNATVTVEGVVGTARQSRVLTRTYNLGDLVRSGFTVTGAQVEVSPLDDPPLVSSVCGAEAAGRVFTGDKLDQRVDAMRAFSQGNKSQPVSIVVTEADLTQAANLGAASANTGANVSGVKVAIDGGGLHLTGQAVAGPLTVNVKGDVVAGPVNDKLVLRLRSLSADPLPAPIVDGLRGGIEKALADATVDVPFLVRRVTLRQGCLGLSGVTPP
jgi:hypothetical protein